MSASEGAIARRPPGDPRVAALVIVPVLATTLLAAGLASAELQAGVTRLSPGEAERSGSRIELRSRTVGAATLVEVEQAAEGVSLLAVADDASAVALADRVGEASGVLTLAGADGAQLQIPFAGLLAATFVADGSWLAVVDGRGALWSVDAASGHAELLADGPFVGSPVIDDDGSLLVLAVPSVAAPYQSHLVRLAPATGVAESLSEVELVYAAFPLEIGDLAIVAHDVGGTTVRQLTAGGERLLADLGMGAVNVAVAPNGRIAFERDGEGVFLVDAPGSAPRSMGAGSRPCFDADGSLLLVRRGSQRVALSLDGSPLAVAGRLAGLPGSAGCLP
jgi:hypothetical protein